MTAVAAELLTGLHARGVILTARGDRLRYDAPRGALTPDDKALLVRFKPEILSLLSPPPPTSADWARKAASLLSTIEDNEQRAGLRFDFEERAGICEFEGGLARDEAERIAYEGLAASVAALRGGEVPE